MDPMTMMMLASLPQTLLGGYQMIKGYGSDNDRPDFKIPDQATNALKSAERQAAERRMPGQSAIEGRLDSTTANTLQTIERMSDSPISGINAASRAYGNQLEKETDLGVKAADFALRNQDILRSEQNRMAEWENKQEDWNTRTPYLQKAAQLSALKEAGLTNLAGGLTDALTGAATMSLLDKSKTAVTQPITSEIANPNKEIMQDLTASMNLGQETSFLKTQDQMNLFDPNPFGTTPIGNNVTNNSGSPVDLRTSENIFGTVVNDLLTKNNNNQTPMVDLVRELMKSSPSSQFSGSEGKKNMFDAYFLGLTPEY